MAKIPPNQLSTAPPWQGATRTIFLVSLVATLIITVLLGTSALPLALTGLLLSYILYPFKRFLQFRVFGGRAGPAVTITVLTIFGSIVLVMLMIIPPLVNQSVNFVDVTVRETYRFMSEPLVFNDETILNEDGEPLIILDEIGNYLNSVFAPIAPEDGAEPGGESGNNLNNLLPIGQEVVQTVLGLTGNFVAISFRIFGSIASLALNTLFLLMLVSYFLADGQMMIENMIEIAPDGFERDLRRLFWELGQVWNDYLRGQLILGGIMGFLMWLLAIVLGLPNALFLAAFAGFMEFIPNIGPVLAMIPPVLLALFSGSSTFPDLNPIAVVAIVIAVWIVVQQLEGLVFVPRIMGSSLKLHPVVIVLGVVIGGSLGGIIGVILSAPTIATGRILIQYIYGRIADEPPFRINPDYEIWLRKNAPHLRYEPEYLATASSPDAMPAADDSAPPESSPAK